MPTRKKVTLRTIAAELGVSVQTVMKALKGICGIDNVVSRVYELCRETRYRAADRLWRLGNPSLPYEHIRIQGVLEVGSTTAPPPPRDLQLKFLIFISQSPGHVSHSSSRNRDLPHGTSAC